MKEEELIGGLTVAESASMSSMVGSAAAAAESYVLKHNYETEIEIDG